MTTSRQAAPLIPDSPRSVFIVNGQMSDWWALFFDQLIVTLQRIFSDEGFIIPSKTAIEITSLTNSENGTILYDSTNHSFKGFQNGAWVTFVTI